MPHFCEPDTLSGGQNFPGEACPYIVLSAPVHVHKLLVPRPQDHMKLPAHLNLVATSL